MLAWHRRCIAEGSDVLMADGSWKPIETVKPGERVLVWKDGGYVEDVVEDVWSTGERECLRISARGFYPVEATPDHRFLLSHRGRREEFDEIQAIGSRQVVLYSGHNAGTRNNPKLARFLGLMLTDGSCTQDQSFKFTNKDEGVLESFSALVQELFPTVVMTDAHYQSTTPVIGLRNGIRGGGSTPNPIKALLGGSTKAKRRVPADVWQYDDESLAAFFSGVLDGDGSLELNTPAKAQSPCGSIKIHVGPSEGLAKDYYYLLAKLGIRVSSVKKRGGNCWTLFIGEHNQAQKLCNMVSLAHTQRKQTVQAILEAPARSDRKRGVNYHIANPRITQVGKRKVYDLATREHHRFIVNGYVVHNCGKDEVALHHTAIKAMERVGNYWHMLPVQEQARKAIWEAVNSHTGRVRWKEVFPPEIIAHVDNQAMKLTFKNGSTWQVLGSDNYESNVGASAVGIVYSEAALGNPHAHGYFRPILLENNGWSMHVSSVRGRNHFYKLFKLHESNPESFCQLLSAETSGVFTEAQLENERREMIAEYGFAIGTSLFAQEYLSDWDSSVIGAVFGKELKRLEEEGRAAPFMYDARYPVDTSWDLGVGDATVVLFWQQIGNKQRLIDWYSSNDTGLEHYAEVLASKPYFYGNHAGPHDIAVREWGLNGVSRLDHAKRLGLHFTRMPNVSKAEQIAAASQLIGLMEVNVGEHPVDDPMEDCRFILEAMKQYKFKFDKTRKVMSKNPEHDWTSHYADALMTRALQVNLGQGSSRQRLQGRSVQAQELQDFNSTRLRDILRSKAANPTGAFG